MITSNQNIRSFRVTVSNKGRTFVITVNPRSEEDSGIIKQGFNGTPFVYWTGEGYNYTVIYPTYYINNILYPSGAFNVTLEDSDELLDRFDTIAINYMGVFVITGTPNAFPFAPSVDPQFELNITAILVVHDTTEPVEGGVEYIYKDNEEWSHTSNLNLDWEFPNSELTGTKCIKTYDIFTTDFIKFRSNNGPIDNESFERLAFAFKRVGGFPQYYFIILQLTLGDPIDSTQVSVFHLEVGNYNINNGDKNDWFVMSVDLKDLTNKPFDTVSMYFPIPLDGGCLIDNVLLTNTKVVANNHKGYAKINTPNGTLDAALIEDTIYLKSEGNIDIRVESGSVVLRVRQYSEDFFYDVGNPDQNFLIPISGIIPKCVYRGRLKALDSEFVVSSVIVDDKVHYNVRYIGDTLELGETISITN